MLRVFFRRLWILLKWTLLIGILVGSVGGFFAWRWFDQEILSTLPADLGRGEGFRIPCSVQVFDADNQQVDEFYLERRIWVPISELPAYVWQAFVAAEDRRFFEHKGVDPLGIGRALIINLQGGAVKQGGSTLTQQIVKNLIVGKERSYRRKLREAVLAWRLERELSKMELLELYINYVALGSGNYGVEAAAREYYGVSARDLDLGQAALIAGLVPAPSRYSPHKNPELAGERREIVLKLMVDQGFVSAAEASMHLQDPVVVPRQDSGGRVGAAYLTEVRREVRRVFGEEMPFLTGMQIRTPFQPAIQAVAEAAVQDGLRALEARQGSRGPTRNIPPAGREAFLSRGDGLQLDPQTGQFRAPIAGECFQGLAGDALGAVEAGPFRYRLRDSELIKKVREPGGAPVMLRSVLTAGDVLEVCIPTERPADEPADVVVRRVRPWAEGAAVVIENHTGNVIALAGGFDVGLEGFIRATQARRQPGSSFKPYVYGAAVAAGWRQTDIIVDGPFALVGTNGLPWVPQNYDGKYFGAVQLRRALALSLNTVAVRLAAGVGVEPIADLAQALGVRTPLRRDLTVALGSSEVTPMDQALGFSSIARGGIRIDPVFLTSVSDRRGRELGRAGGMVLLPGSAPRALPGPPGVRAMADADAYVLIDMMRNAFLTGTARKGQRPGMDFAGKTGTTSGYIDAWFVGFSPRYTVAVWVGTDGTTSIGDRETGGKVALPVWSTIMEALPNVQGERFAVPDDVILMPEPPLWLGFRRGTVDVLEVPDVEGPLPPFGFGVPTAAPASPSEAG